MPVRLTQPPGWWGRLVFFNFFTVMREPISANYPEIARAEFNACDGKGYNSLVNQLGIHLI
jgi:hypothetical protein